MAAVDSTVELPQALRLIEGSSRSAPSTGSMGATAKSSRGSRERLAGFDIIARHSWCKWAYSLETRGPRQMEI
jgi:hypothetical protein